MKNVLHISANCFDDISKDYHTKKIWKEMSKGFDEYHVFARSVDNKFHLYKEDNIYLHLMPKIFTTSKEFFFWSFYGIYLVNKLNITHVLTQCPIICGPVSLIIKEIFNIPYMCEIHGMEYFRILKSKKIHNRIVSKLMRIVLKKANKVRSLSTEMTNLIHEYDIECESVLIPNRVNLELFNKPKINFKLSDPIKIVSVGRFVWEKSYHIAIEAIHILREKYNIELTLIGGGKLYEELKLAANGSEYITLIEWVTQDELVSYLQNSDIYIQTSISEGMPRTILEAMGMRLPIITTNVGAIKGIIRNGYNGLLIDPNDLGQLVQAIEILINDINTRKHIAENAYIDAKEKYEWNKVFEQYRQHLYEINRR